MAERRPKSQFVSSISKVSTWAEYESTPSEPLLPMAGIESVSISHMFNIQPIKANEIDRDQFRKVLNESHDESVSQGKSPGIGSARDQSSADLVIFSACSTGLGTNVGNEALGFSHVLLEAGCSSYLGALWEVNDIATMLMMILFFRRIRAGKDDVSLAELWRLAMGDFYHLNPHRARAIIQGLIDIWKNTTPAARSIVQGGLVYLKRLAQELDQGEDPLDLDFQHPCLYASFTLVGNGALRLRGPAA